VPGDPSSGTLPYVQSNGCRAQWQRGWAHSGVQLSNVHDGRSGAAHRMQRPEGFRENDYDWPEGGLSAQKMSGTINSRQPILIPRRQD